MAIISYPWKDDPLEYLVRLKFPFETAHKNQSFGSLTWVPEAQDATYLQRAADYRNYLGTLPLTELLSQAEEVAREEGRKALAKRDAEEARRFFNQPQATLVVHYWSRMSVWTIDEATALSFGKDPRHVNWAKLKGLVQVSPFAKAYQEQQDLFNRARFAGQLWDQTIPGVFLAWAERMKVEMPASLVDAVKALGIQIADWKTAYDGLKVRVQELEEALAKHAATPLAVTSPAVHSKDKGLSSRERNSLLTLVIGMATAWYGHDVSKTRTTTAKDISDELQRVGLSLSDDTIRTYLQEAGELLPPSETEQKR